MALHSHIKAIQVCSRTVNIKMGPVWFSEGFVLSLILCPLSLTYSSGKSSAMNMALIPPATTMEIVTYNWKGSTSTTMKPQVSFPTFQSAKDISLVISFLPTFILKTDNIGVFLMKKIKQTFLLGSKVKHVIC